MTAVGYVVAGGLSGLLIGIVLLMVAAIIRRNCR